VPTVDDNKNRNCSSRSNSSGSGSSSSNNNVNNNNRISGIGDGNTVDNLSIQQCEEFEKQLTDRLLNIKNRKVYTTSLCIFLILTLALLFLNNMWLLIHYFSIVD
jgi:hypothetical protein